jgi:hypothetical protein
MWWLELAAGVALNVGLVFLPEHRPARRRRRARARARLAP